MVQRTCVAKAENAFDRAESFIRRAENKAFYSRINKRAGAHRARFYRRIKNGFRQPIVADFACCLAQNKNFGVRRRVALRDCPVSGCGKQLSVRADKTRADGNFVQF